MHVNLSQGPIDPQDPTSQTMLNNLQGNILTHHGRDHAVHIFLQFTAGPDAVRSWMRDFAARYVTSAQQQLQEASDFKTLGIAGQLFGNLCLSATGYRALGYTELEVQQAFAVDEEDRKRHLILLEFDAGMAAPAHVQRLHDPRPQTWDQAYRDRIDAMILLAHTDEESLSRHAQAVRSEVAEIAIVVTTEWGHKLRNSHKDPIEPFGYVDGISQPLFLQDRAAQTSSTSMWDPSASLDLILLPDPFAPQTPAGQDCCGSYLVFRKLEQNIREFHKRIQVLAGALKCSNDMAQALVLGRFNADGTPLTASATAGMGRANDFNYSQDAHGTKCPFHAHIRRLNPRGESSEGEAAERRHQIARRSIPYGVPSEKPLDYSQVDQLPTEGVGILFMCFQRSLSNQFGFLQTVWANSPYKNDGSQITMGLDPIIGRPAEGKSVEGQRRWPVQWGAQDFNPFDFRSFITLKGGEFLFAPSRPFFQSL
jgi:Dyp-type peroxidase family